MKNKTQPPLRKVENPEMSREIATEIAKEIDEVKERILRGDNRTTGVIEDVNELKLRVGKTEEVAYFARNIAVRHIEVCDKHKEQEEIRRQESRERLMQQHKDLTDAVRGVQKAVENQGRYTDKKIQAQDDKWTEVKDKVLITVVSALFIGFTGLIIYIWKYGIHS